MRDTILSMRALTPTTTATTATTTTATTTTTPTTPGGATRTRIVRAANGRSSPVACRSWSPNEVSNGDGPKDECDKYWRYRGPIEKEHHIVAET